MNSPDTSLPAAAAAIRTRIMAAGPAFQRLYMNHLLMFLGITLGITLCVTAGLFAFDPDENSIYGAVILLSLLFSFFAFRLIDRLYQRAAKKLIEETLLAACGVAFNPRGLFSPHGIGMHKIMPLAADKLAVTDGFEGIYNDVTFKIQEMNENGGRGARFIVTRVGLRNPLASHTIFGTHRAINGVRPRFADYKSINLVISKLQQSYEALADDTVEARVILTPAFMAQCAELAKAPGTVSLIASFMDSDVVIVTETRRSFFAPAPLWAPVGNNTLEALYGRLEGILKIVGALRVNPQLRV